MPRATSSAGDSGRYKRAYAAAASPGLLLPTQLLGRTPNRRLKALLNAAGRVKPTEAATLFNVLPGVTRRRFASLRRRFSTNSEGGLPNTLLNARLKWSCDMQARRASASTERSP